MAVHIKQAEVGLLAIKLQPPVGLQAGCPLGEGLPSLQPQQGAGAAAHAVAGQKGAVAGAVLGVCQLSLGHPLGPVGGGTHGGGALCATWAAAVGGLVLPAAQVNAPLRWPPGWAGQRVGLVAGPTGAEAGVAA